jgi:hypothetical protein
LPGSLADALDDALANVTHVWLLPGEWESTAKELSGLQQAIRAGDKDRMYLLSRRLGNLSSSLDFTPIEAQLHDPPAAPECPPEFINHLVAEIHGEVAEMIRGSSGSTEPQV